MNGCDGLHIFQTVNRSWKPFWETGWSPYDCHGAREPESLPRSRCGWTGWERGPQKMNKSAADRSRKALRKIRIQNAEAKGQKLKHVQICSNMPRCWKIWKWYFANTYIFGKLPLDVKKNGKTSSFMKNQVFCLDIMRYHSVEIQHRPCKTRAMRKHDILRQTEVTHSSALLPSWVRKITIKHKHNVLPL